jgi:pentose-5-phosphate-3-epimerase
VTEDNIGEAHDAGATLLVAGAAIFGHDDPAGAYRRLAHAES